MSEKTAKKKTILVVEDEVFLIRSLKIRLDREDFEVKTAKNGSEAWEVMQKFPIDLAVIDIIMPERDGEWLVKKIRDDEKLAYTPIIILTNLNYGNKLDRVAAKGVYRILTKTETSMESLVGNIKEVLRVKS